MDRKFEIMVIIAVGFLLIGVLAGLSLIGLKGRTVLGGRQIIVLSEPYRVVTTWEKEGVRGRVLVHFDRQIHAGSIEGGVSNENYVYQAAEMNLIRKIYHIVPDASWPEVRDTLSRMPGVSNRGELFRLTLEGTPIIVSPLQHLPVISEKALINISGGWNEDDLRQMASLLGSGTLNADIITVSGPDTDRVMQTFRGQNVQSF
jgi:hypothetical protein